MTVEHKIITMVLFKHYLKIKLNGACHIVQLNWMGCRIVIPTGPYAFLMYAINYQSVIIE